MDHLTRKSTEPIEISIWRPYFKMADTLGQQLSNIIVYLLIQAWKLAWEVSVGHLTRKLSEPIEISIWRPYFKMADTLVQQLSHIILYLVLQSRKLVWAVSVGHLTRILSEPIEISIWRPYFKMADILVQELSSLFGDTSMKITMSSLCGSLDNKSPTDTWHCKREAIFQDGHHLSGEVKWYTG